MPIATTQTGKFPIGFRLGGSPWQTELASVVKWASSHGFHSMDLGPETFHALPLLREAGLEIGSMDIADWQGFHDLISADSKKREQAVEQARRTIEEASGAGVRIFWTLLLPENAGLKRQENFHYALESYARIGVCILECGAKLVVEGWPGPGALGCTPETCRAFLKSIPASGVNYDPSHLLRMGIDPIRFLEEFAGQVFHVHGKDTELDGEALYEHGHEQPATFADPHPYGAWAWRYTIPGHGQTPWTKVLEILAGSGYRGVISIELEDARFHGTEAAEQRGLIRAREFLEGC